MMTWGELFWVTVGVCCAVRKFMDILAHLEGEKKRG